MAIGWSPEGTATWQREHSLSLQVRLCPMCWGQRMVFHKFEGGGYIPVYCETCNGTGKVKY
jgi:DnaJ-class molecular chaperone